MAKKNPDKQPYHHGDLKRVLTQTALRLIQENGNWQFTFRELARQAGVSHAAPYKHFADKSALLIEVALLGFEQLLEELSIAVHAVPDTSPRDQFIAIAKAYIHFGLQQSSQYRLMYSIDVQSAHLSENALAIHELMHGILRKGQDQGVFKKHALQGQTAACWAQVHGLTLLSVDGVLLTETVGANPVEMSLEILLEGVCT